MRKARGFTLLEVLIALGILTLVLTAVLKMQVKSTELSRRAVWGFYASVKAADYLEELLAKKFSGISETTQEPYTLSARTTSLNKIYPLEQLTLKVSRPELTPVELSVYRLK